jgi:hypothetical protein
MAVRTLDPSYISTALNFEHRRLFPVQRRGATADLYSIV